jgi:Leucine-rich repeat (LRR) protein
VLLAAVVSRNEIEDISPVRTLKSLTKLSASHNGIVVIPDFSDLHDLGELRLNDNKIMLIPDTLHLNFNLKILDLGNNRIAKLRYRSSSNCFVSA